MTGAASRFPDVTIRRMRWWDVEVALQVERDLFPDPWSEATFWAELAGVPETRHYVVAECAGGLVAYAGLSAAGLSAAGHQADVQTLAVARDHQGRGLGATLLEALLAEAERRGSHEVMLEVRADNDPALRLYARLGFERVGVRRGYYQPGRVDAVVMRRRRLADRR